MKNFKLTNKKLHYILIILCVIIFAIPMFQLSLVNTDDGKLHILRIIGVENAINSGEFPPIISPDFCKTWGYAVNLFYNPISTYIPLLLNFIFHDISLSIKLFICIAMLFAGIAMYRFLNNVTKNENIGFIASILYITLPYYLSDIYIRGGVAEVTALAFIPIVFYGLYNLLHQDGKKHYYIAIGAIGLTLSHTITTVYVAIFCLIYILINYKTLKNKEIIKKCAINVLFILLITSFFTIPLFANKINANYTIFESQLMGTNSIEVTQNALNIKELFIYDKEKEVHFELGIPILLGLILTPFAWRKIRKENKEQYIILILFSIISIWMTTKYFPWLLLPDFLSVIQFPWRMLGIGSIFISSISAINIWVTLKTIIKQIDKIKYPIIITIFSILVIFANLTPFTYTKGNDKEYEKYRKENITLTHHEINREYLPINAYLQKDGFLNTRDNKIHVVQGQANIENENKYKLKTMANIKTKETEKITLEFPYIYYLGYNIYIQNENGEKIKLDAKESENGFVSTSFTGVSNAQIVCEYKTPAIYWISIGISIISIIIFVIYLNRGKKNNDRQKN